MNISKRLILMNAFFEIIQLLFFCKYKLSDSHASNSKRSELYERSLQIIYLDKQSWYNILLGFRSSNRRYSFKKGVLKNFADFTRKRLKTRNFIIKRLQQRYFSVKFTKLLRTLILKNNCERLLLSVSIHSRNLHILTTEMYEANKSLIITELLKQCNGLDYNSGRKLKFTILAINKVENTGKRKPGFCHILRSGRPKHFVKYRSFT